MMTKYDLENFVEKGKETGNVCLSNLKSGLDKSQKTMQGEEKIFSI